MWVFLTTEKDLIIRGFYFLFEWVILKAEVKSILKELGLKDNEIKIYMYLLEKGLSTVSFISKATNIERSFCYHVLEQLVQKGLILSSVKDNKKYFSSSDPKNLVNLIERRKQELEVLNIKVADILPSFYKLAKEKDDFHVDVYRGSAGFKAAMQQVLRDSKCYKVLGYHETIPNIASTWYKYWVKERLKRKIKRYFLVPQGIKDEVTLLQPLTKVRYLLSGLEHQSPTTTIIFGENKLLISLPTDEDYHGILITNKQLHDNYLDYFNVMWESAKK